MYFVCTTTVLILSSTWPEEALCRIGIVHNFLKQSILVHSVFVQTALMKLVLGQVGCRWLLCGRW